MTSSGAERVTSRERWKPGARARDGENPLGRTPEGPYKKGTIRTSRSTPQLLSILSTVVSGLVFSPSFFPPTTTAGSPCSSAHGRGWEDFGPAVLKLRLPGRADGGLAWLGLPKLGLRTGHRPCRARGNLRKTLVSD
jgi:hypothetical protein